MEYIEHDYEIIGVEQKLSNKINHREGGCYVKKFNSKEYKRYLVANELLDLFSQRSEELIQSLDTYDKELRGWIDANMAVIKQFGFEKRAKQEIAKWDANIKKLKTKIEHFRKG